MNILVQPKHIELSERESEYVQRKLETLGRFCSRLKDSASQIQLHVEKSDIKTTDHKILMEATITLPHGHLRAETDALTVMEGVDVLEDKLKKQCEKYKAKHRGL